MRAKLKLVIEETSTDGTTTTTLPIAFAMFDEMSNPLTGVYDARRGDHRRLRLATWLLPALTETIMQENYAADPDPEEDAA